MNPRTKASRSRAPLRSVMIANRGEIALRVVRALQDLGIESVVAHSAADIDSLPARRADRSVWLGPAPAADSYLAGDRVIEAALKAGVDAIHPGYGFLSEDANFAEAVEAAGLRFVGPTVANLRQLGDKAAARDVMAQAGIPPVPGSEGVVPNSRAAARFAERLGYPLLLKAVGGGGGKGIRIVHDASELETAYRAATSEAQAACGNGALILERYLERARHVEVQVVGDGAGGVLIFPERDCSIQRRLQKLCEESPCTRLDARQRERLFEAVGRASAATKYRGAGTFEFLLTEDGDLFFLEVNTRIQVEHPVTELVTGEDLVTFQFRIAEGETLPPWQDLDKAFIPGRGAAVEWRINAEDWRQDFRPAIGTVQSLRWPAGPWVRTDTAMESGSVIPPHYDSLIAKIITWGQSRTTALCGLRRALAETRIGGVPTTLALGLALLNDEDFLSDRHHCQFLAGRLQSNAFNSPPAPELKPLLAAAAAVFRAERGAAFQAERRSQPPTTRTPWQQRSCWGDGA